MTEIIILVQVFSKLTVSITRHLQTLHSAMTTRPDLLPWRWSCQCSSTGYGSFQLSQCLCASFSTKCSKLTRWLPGVFVLDGLFCHRSRSDVNITGQSPIYWTRRGTFHPYTHTTIKLLQWRDQSYTTVKPHSTTIWEFSATKHLKLYSEWVN